MAVLTVQDAPVTGLDAVVFIAATALDEVPTGSGIFLIVRNTNVASRTVTVATPGTVRGLTIEDPQMTVAATNGLAVMPMIRNVFGALAQVTYSVITDVTVAAVKLAR